MIVFDFLNMFYNIQSFEINFKKYLKYEISKNLYLISFFIFIYLAINLNRFIII